MKKNPTKKKPVINQDAVTVKDLEKEIASLRVGIANLVRTAGQLAQANDSLVREQRACRDANTQLREELNLAKVEVDQQQEFQSRAHETIELLIKKMAYAPQVH
jgi:regulator of replication initiation timing